MSGLVANLVKDAFQIVAQVDGDLVVSATYTAVSPDNTPNYDPVTGVVSSVVTNYPIVNAIFSKFRQRQTDSLTVVDNRAYLIFSADQLEALAPGPQINDQVTIGLDVWNVQDVEFPPGTSLYKLLIRKA